MTLISIKVNEPDFTAVQTGKYELRTVAVVQMWHVWTYFVGSVKYEDWLGSRRFKEKCYLHLQDHISKLGFECDKTYYSKTSEIHPYNSRHKLNNGFKSTVTHTSWNDLNAFRWFECDCHIMHWT